MKKRYSAHYWKNLVIGTAVAMAIPALYAPAVLAADNVVSTATSGTYGLLGTDSLTVTPSGSITVDNSSYWFPDAIGVDVDGALTGSIVNNGIIDAGAFAYGSSAGAEATGVFVDGDLNGSLINSGDIIASAGASGFWADASAAGVGVAGDLIGTLTNSGAIDATADASGVLAAAFAVGVGSEFGDLAGVLTNSGTIDASATVSSASSANAYAFAVYFGGDLSGTLTNSGEINAVAIADGGEGYAEATGINVGTLSGTLTNSGDMLGNSGDINATAEAHGYSVSAVASGIIVGDLSGALTNSGTITAKATSYSSDAGALGIDTASLSGDGANITNSGTISVTAEGDYSAYAYAIDTSDLSGVGAYINNSGIITATAVANVSSAYATGIYTGDMSGAGANITNSGTITVDATSFDSDVSAWGIDTGELSGEGAYISNSGTIDVTANGYDYATAYGVETEALGAGAYINNSATIIAKATSINYTAYADGIKTGALGAEASIINSGTIDVTADGSSYAYARGIRTEEIEAGAYITNSGTIDVTADGYYSANAWGVKTGYLREDASITNSGTITVKASSDDSDAVAWGIKLGQLDGENASVVNSGSITLTADGYTGASAFGIHTGDMDYANTFIVNSGIITVEANTVNQTAYAIGIRTGDLFQDGDYISNSGTINVGASSIFSDASAYGISADSLSVDSYIANSGMITATAPDNNEAYSIYVGYGEGTVFNSGILNGNIYLGDGGEGGVNLVNSGTLAIPTGASGYIGGNYDQIDGGIFEIGAFDAEEYGSMDVGIANLEDNANIRVNVATDNSLQAGDILEDIIDAGTLFSNGYNVTDNSLALSFTALDLGDNTLDLTVTDTGMTSYRAAVVSGGLGLGEGVAGVLDGFYTNGAPNDDFDELLYALGSLNTAPEVAGGVSKLLPLLSGGGSLAALNALHGTNGVIQSRLSGSGFSSGDEVSADRRFWIKPFGSWADQDDRDGAIGYDADTYGVALGADTELNSTVRLGAALAYSNSDVESNSTVAPQTVDIDIYQIAAYGSYSINESTDLNFQADIGKGNYDGNRTINLGGLSSVASSDYDSWNYHLGAGLGHDISIAEKTTFTPSVRVDYTMIDTDSYSETGSPFNLNVGSTTTDELVFAVDGKINQTLNDTTSLTANLGLGFDAINDQASLTSSFVGGGASFATNGIDQSPLLLRAGLGLEMNPSSNLEIVTRYDVEGRDDFMNHTASIKLRMPF